MLTQTNAMHSTLILTITMEQPRPGTFTASSLWAALYASVSGLFHKHSGLVRASASRAACRDHGHASDCTPHGFRLYHDPCPCRCGRSLGAFCLRNPNRSRMMNRSWTRRSIRRQPSACGRCSILFSNHVRHTNVFRCFKGRCIPLELFLPKPSLSTTSSAHCTDRPLAVCRPRRRSILGAESGAFCDVADTVVVWDADGVGALRCETSCDMVVVQWDFFEVPLSGCE